MEFVPFKARCATAVFVMICWACSAVRAKCSFVLVVMTDAGTLDFAVTAVKRDDHRLEKIHHKQTKVSAEVVV